MSDAGEPTDPIASLNAFWRDALQVAMETVPGDVASMAMLLTAVQYLRGRDSSEGTGKLLESLGGMLRNGTMISVTVGDVTLNLKDHGSQTQ